MLEHTKLKNVEMATSFGKFKIDSNGEIKGLSEKQEIELGKLRDFRYTNTEAESKAEEDKKAEAEKAEEIKETTKKAKTTRRKTAKKTDDQNEDPVKNPKPKN